MPSPPDRSADRATRAGWVAFAVGLTIVVPGEFARVRAIWSATQDPLAWLFHWNLDTTPFVPLLVAWPFVAFFSNRVPLKANPPAEQRVHPVDTRRLTVACLVAGLLSLGMSLWVAAAYGDLPPAYHDEYSYAFQAKTFLNGRVAFPSAPEPRLFDQMHVLNEGRFASRYLPGTGLWLMPFQRLGQPYAAQWLAGALSAALVVLIGTEVASLRAGFLAGVLTAMSPGLALFSNLLLAHHPTMLGLLLFVWAFFRMLKMKSLGWAVLSGLGLTFAMFCRPMTAAGVAFPFGLWMLGAGFRSNKWTRGILQQFEGWTLCVWLKLAAGLSAPLVIGFAVMGWYNRELTGSVWVSPYQLYTDTYTPRHVYGFNNVIRGEKNVGPRVIEQYDRWAENLTWNVAWRNIRERIVASAEWTLGLVPLAMMLALVFVDDWRDMAFVFWSTASPRDKAETRTRMMQSGLIFAAILWLHLVHVPYWFVGIMHWHYVFESASLLLVLTGVAADRFVTAGQLARNRSPIWWGTAVLAVAVLVNVTSAEGLWTGRLWQGVSEVRFARVRHGQFRAGLKHHVEYRPAIVLVKPDPSDRHIDFVTNDPDLTGPVLIGRWLKDVPLSRVRELYPDRAVYLYDAGAGSWQLLARP